MHELIDKGFDFLNKLVWGPATLFLFLFVGVFVSCKLRFFQVRFFGLMLRETIGKVFKKDQKKNGISPFQAVSTALAGTIGTGSITGVAMAIRAGGPGVIFWMWCFSFLGMAIKFSEIFLSLRYREMMQNEEYIGGPMYYIQKGLGSRLLATAFSLLAFLCSFGIGNITQSNAISSVFENTLGFKREFLGIALVLLVALIIIGGIKRICNVNQYLVPFMTLLYIFAAVTVLMMNYQSLPSIFTLIFHSAFSFRSVSFGAVGYGFFKGVQYGISRSIFSNEAGLGSAPIAHAVSKEKDPIKQGLWGIFEVFFTTLVICTLSGLVILTSDSWYLESVSGAEIVIESFHQSLPSIGSFVVGMTTVFFAFSSIIGWSYYGEVCILYLFKNYKKAAIIFRVIYIIFVFIGAVMKADLVWNISECLNGLMAIPNLIAVLLLSGEVSKKCKEFQKKHKKC